MRVLEPMFAVEAMKHQGKVDDFHNNVMVKQGAHVDNINMSVIRGTTLFPSEYRH